MGGLGQPAWLHPEASGAAVVVLQTDDVVLTQIAAKLDLDDFHRVGGEIGQAVHLADGNIDVLTRQKIDFPFTYSNALAA